MKKISLQTKLEDCSVPKRYIDVIKREAEDIRTIFDLVSSYQRDFLGIKGAGRRFLNKWGDFLKQYGLYIGMSVGEILQYEPDGIIQFYRESGKLHSKLIEPFNCNPESSIDREQGPKYRPFKSQEECWQEMQKHQPFGWVKEKVSVMLYLINGISDMSIVIMEDITSFEEAINIYEFKDGTPFGIKED